MRGAEDGGSACLRPPGVSIIVIFFVFFQNSGVEGRGELISFGLVCRGHMYHVGGCLVLFTVLVRARRWVAGSDNGADFRRLSERRASWPGA